MKIERPIIALDFPDREACRNFLKKFPEEEKLFVKIGMELYYSEGQDMVKEIMDLGHDVFLDLKCHDIPHTVESAMRVLGKLGVSLTTLHASGGSEMMKAAKNGLLEGAQSNGKKRTAHCLRFGRKRQKLRRTGTAKRDGRRCLFSLGSSDDCRCNQ